MKVNKYIQNYSRDKIVTDKCKKKELTNIPLQPISRFPTGKEEEKIKKHS